MKRFDDEAILLEIADLQEADRVVVFLSRTHGKKRGAARGAKRRFSRFAGELQPLARVRISWLEKQGRELVRVASVELQRSPKRLAASLEGILAAAYVGESTATFTPEDEPAERTYRLLAATVEALEGGVDREVALRYFESWLLRLAGIFPPPDDCPACGEPFEGGAVLAASGESLLCRRCAGENGGGRAVSAAAIEFWRRIGRESPTALAERPPAPSTLAEVEEVTSRIRRHFLQSEIRSYLVLRRTLAGLERAERR